MLSSTRVLFVTSHIIATGDTSSCPGPRRRASVRSHAEFSSLSSNSSLEATRNHTMGRNDEKCSQKSKKNKTISYACRVCRSGGGSGNLTSRTIWYCKECSKACKSDENRVYLHSQCFGRWHDIVDARNNRS